MSSSVPSCPFSDVSIAAEWSGKKFLHFLGRGGKSFVGTPAGSELRRRRSVSLALQICRSRVGGVAAVRFKGTIRACIASVSAFFVLSLQGKMFSEGLDRSALLRAREVCVCGCVCFVLFICLFVFFFFWDLWLFWFGLYCVVCE